MKGFLERLREERLVGGQTTAFHADRFSRLTTNPETLLESSPVSEVQEPSYTKTTGLIIELQKKARKERGNLILTGGWASFFLSYPVNLRPRSLDVDFFTDPTTALFLSGSLGLQQVVGWGCWAGNRSLTPGVSVRIEVNVGDDAWPYINIRPPSEFLKKKDMVMVAKPLYVIGGKLVRTLIKGPQWRDQLDVGSILLGPYIEDEGLIELKGELNQDEKARSAFKSLNLPDSIADKLLSDQLEKLLERVRLLVG